MPGGDLILGDCLEKLPQLPFGCIDLAYLDPPFLTNVDRKGSVAIGRQGGEYADRWDNLSQYLAFMRQVIAHLHNLLSPNGVILLHCDWRTVHHQRLLLDEIFSADAFVNHLIWSYGLGGSSPRRFARKHDDILFYAKSDQYWFEPPKVPASSRRLAGQMKKQTDVLNIPSLNNMASERTGYPTQKPLALLELLISACCPPGGTVLDPFCGSGTTLVAANRLNRHWIGIDENPQAIELAASRLRPSSSSETRCTISSCGGSSCDS